MSDAARDQNLRKDSASARNEDYDGDARDRRTNYIRDRTRAPAAADSENIGAQKYVEQQGDKGGAENDQEVLQRRFEWQCGCGERPGHDEDDGYQDQRDRGHHARGPAARL